VMREVVISYFVYDIQLCVFAVRLRLCDDENSAVVTFFFFFKQKTAYEIGLGIPAEPLFRSKQMDNRIKLLEEILSFRMQGVEFDNGDMYVDGHKAASDVRDEFVSVTEKLMDELAQCYNVLPQLDINNTIDHRPEG